MPLVRYTRNVNSTERTSRLKVASGVLVLGGPAVEVTEDEYRRLSGRYSVELAETAPSQITGVAPSQTPVVHVVTPSSDTPATSTFPSTPSATVAPSEQDD